MTKEELREKRNRTIESLIVTEDDVKRQDEILLEVEQFLNSEV